MSTVLVEKGQTTKPKQKYHRLVERAKELTANGKAFYERKLSLMMKGEDLPKEEEQEYTLTLMEDDCIMHFFEAEGYKTYGIIAEFCKENGFERVVDIGCAYGHQSECFLQEGIDYVGVNSHKSSFWNADRFEYVTGHYPCELPIRKNDLGVSVLALTWNCYLYEKEETLKQQCEALQRDFEHCLLYLTEGAMQYLSQYFKKVEKLDRGLYYFSNKEEVIMSNNKNIKLVGTEFEFEAIRNGEIVTSRATVTEVEQHEELGPVYHGVTAYGNTVRLTEREIKTFIPNKKGKN